jgi:hypothetical protein
MTSILDKDIVLDYDQEANDIVSSLLRNTEVDIEEEISLCLE